MTRNGKIARLSYELREELNLRILNGETATQILDWIHEQDEVWDMLEEHFGGADINEQNLSEWKMGGHQSWLDNRETRETVLALARQSEDLGEASEEANMGLCLANLLMVEFIKLAKVLVQKEEDPQKRMKQLCDVNRELCRLRGANARDVRTGIRQQRCDWEAEDRQMAAEEKHKAWVKKQRLAKYQLPLSVAILARDSKDKVASWNLAAHEVEIENDLPAGLLERNHKDGMWFWDDEEERWEWVEKEDMGKSGKRKAKIRLRQGFGETRRKQKSKNEKGRRKKGGEKKAKKEDGGLKVENRKTGKRAEHPTTNIEQSSFAKATADEPTSNVGREEEPPEGGTPNAGHSAGAGSIEKDVSQNDADQIKVNQGAFDEARGHKVEHEEDKMIAATNTGTSG